MRNIIMGTILTVMMTSAFGQAKFDSKKAFIKVKKGAALPASKHIKSSKLLFGGNYLVETDNVLLLEKALKGNKEIAKIERNYFAGKRTLPKAEKNNKDLPFNLFSIFNDPKVSKIWSFLDADDNGVSVEKAYLAPLAIQKEEIIVAVVDTGVDYNHEDLKDVMWKNPGEIAGNGIDDDNNGYIDDIYGIDPLANDTDPMASHSHGTHVAGTIGAKQNNHVGIAGIASNVKIMAIRAVPDDADETDADVVESFLYAAKNGAKIINCSFGKDHNEGGDIVKETINHIGDDYGTLVVAAAGNDYQTNIDRELKYPASFDSETLLVIASTNKAGYLSSFSNIGGANVDVAAPGSNIYSTVPGNDYASMSGTSMATPTTVGVAAEILSHFPTLSPRALKKVLMESVTKVRSFGGKMVTGGRVDLYEGLQYALNNYNTLEKTK